MKVSKNQLKSIVKECLLEILSEGMGPSTPEDIKEAAKPRVRPQPIGTTNPSFASLRQKTASMTKMQPMSSDVLKETIRREAGDNPVMVDILADTAANTLPTMLESDRMKSHIQPIGVAERLVAAATPDQLFGDDAASKWAALAFSEPIKK